MVSILELLSVTFTSFFSSSSSKTVVEGMFTSSLSRVAMKALQSCLRLNCTLKIS